MAKKAKLYLEKKTLIVAICMIGILAVSYGMLNDNNLIFTIGVSFIIGGYLLIRRRIKESIRENVKGCDGKMEDSI